MWNACSQEEARVSLVNNKEDEEENISNAHSAHHKKKRNFKKFKRPKKKADLLKIECYNCHNMGHYKSHCLRIQSNKKREREHANVVDEAPSKRNKTKESEIKDLFAKDS